MLYFFSFNRRALLWRGNSALRGQIFQRNGGFSLFDKKMGILQLLVHKKNDTFLFGRFTESPHRIAKSSSRTRNPSKVHSTTTKAV